MKLLYTLTAFFSLFIQLSQAQFKHDYVWLMGIPAPNEPGYPDNAMNILDFNDGKFKIIRDSINAYFYLDNASISDENGNLLFHTDGCQITDASGFVMQNGYGINPGEVHNGQCPFGYPAVQGSIILPLPGSDSIYYIFHTAERLGVASPFLVYTDKMYYSIVDISKNGGLGEVGEINQIIIEDTLFDGTLSAVKHNNGADWWVIVSRSVENLYYKVLLTSNGVSEVYEQKIGIKPNSLASGGGQSAFSPDGTKYAIYNKRNQLFLMDFDRNTGEFSNFQQIYVDTVEGHWGALAFSSNSRFIYISNQLNLYQFDLQAPDIEASKVLIGEYDGYKYNDLFFAYFYLMQLAPDCKIYMATQQPANVLHVIHNPNEPGLACNFEQHGIHLPAINANSMPKFPNYRLGTPYPVCDSNIVYVTSSVAISPQQAKVKVYPNPALDDVIIVLPEGLVAFVEWRLFNQLGQPVRQINLPPGQQQNNISLEDLPPGLYFWQLTSKDKRVDTGKLIILK